MFGVFDVRLAVLVVVAVGENQLVVGDCNGQARREFDLHIAIVAKDRLVVCVLYRFLDTDIEIETYPFALSDSKPQR